MHQDIMSELLQGLVAHLSQDDAWDEGRTHEGWSAVEAARYFKRELGPGVAREVPYIVVTGDPEKTKYEDVYVQYQPGTEAAPRHLFFEIKCVPWAAAARSQTLRKFRQDVQQKLANFDVAETLKHWEKHNDAWCRYLKRQGLRFQQGTVIGIGGVQTCAHPICSATKWSP